MVTKLDWLSQKRLLNIFSSFIFLLCVVCLSHADEYWPREIKEGGVTILIYQPQPETFKGNKLTARAAVGVTLNGNDDPVFGAVWTTSRVETNREKGIVTIVDFQVDDIRFPEASQVQLARIKKLLETQIPKWEMDISLEGLTATLAASEKASAVAENLQNDPPPIIFSTVPAVLLLYDKEPQLKMIENSGMMRVVNTPLPVILDSTSSIYYLNGGEIWYEAKDAMGPWQHIEKPPQPVASLINPEADTRVSAGHTDSSKIIPRIIVATEPTELLVSDGEPKYSPIDGTDLLYMSNSESDIILEIPTQKYFVLLSGRWFSGKSLNGPWEYVASNNLPSDFFKIPYESVNGHLLAFVAGTEQAQDMVMDNQIPQTASIKRTEVDIEVIYDGKPQFKNITGTQMAYAVNTSFAVLHINQMYYLCHEAIWYVSDQPTGKWMVAVKLPPDIQEIPPDNPLYHVKYVYIYGHTPTVVYVGYTPGYVGSYIYGPCVVYGTGYYYSPWIGPVLYYPRPYTWGFHVRYNPIAGWGFGFSYAAGPFRLTTGFGVRHGWYGPGRFRPYPYRSYRKTTVNVNRNININTGNISIDKRSKTMAVTEKNIYKSKKNRNLRVGKLPDSNAIRPKVVNDQPNNIFTDKKGNIHRRTEKGWQQRENKTWSNRPTGKPKESAAEHSKKGTVQSPVLGEKKPGRVMTKNPSQLQREHNARQRSVTRTHQGRQGRSIRRR